MASPWIRASCYGAAWVFASAVIAKTADILILLVFFASQYWGPFSILVLVVAPPLSIPQLGGSEQRFIVLFVYYGLLIALLWPWLGKRLRVSA